MRDLPSGTVTFLFTDVEGSTRLLDDLGAAAYADALAEHRRVIRKALGEHSGVEVDTEGDAFLIAFHAPVDALRAAADAQAELATGPIRVRMGIHTGTPLLTEEGYVGPDVHLGARIGAAGHGGQVLVSKETVNSLGEGSVVELIDLGEHRLKDIATPTWIYQLAGDAFPPLRTISNTNLPRPASSFVGREIDLSFIKSSLQHDGRIVTLTGPGGSGKTRLAIEAATDLVPEFANGVFWVPLAALRDPTLVMVEIGRTLGAREDVASHIGTRRMLLVLDNLEQVIEAAGDLSGLLEQCPNLHLLATSRESLRIRGEIQFPVAALPTVEATELFTDRSGVSASETVELLCRRLDNLPLAVELAAARANVLTPEQILDRLSARLDLLKGGRDTDPRQLTLRATIAWSHELLSSNERTLLARLSVFRGGWRLEAAEQICDADIDDLQALVTKSLISKSGDRFGMLEMIREFAAERLGDSTEADSLHGRHAEYFIALSKAIEPELRGNPKPGLDRLDEEHDNIRAVFDYLDETRQEDRALGLCALLWRFWSQRGHHIEGARRTNAELEASSELSTERMHALIGAVGLAVLAGDEATVARRYPEAAGLAADLHDEWGIAYTNGVLAYIKHPDDPERELVETERSIETFRALGDEYYALVSMTNAAFVYTKAKIGRPERVRELLEESLTLARLSRQTRVEARILQLMSAASLRALQPSQAAATLGLSLRLFEELGDIPELIVDLAISAHALVMAGQSSAAGRVLFAADAQRQHLGLVDDQFDDAFGAALEILENESGADLDSARRSGAALTMEAAFELALRELAQLSAAGEGRLAGGVG